jgi:hypothetical protein
MTKIRRILYGLSISMILLPLVFMPIGGAAGPATNFVHRAIFESASYSAQQIAQLTDLYICHVELGSKVQSIHKVRPDLICLLYRDIRAVKSSAERQTFLANGWILKDVSGTLIKSIDYGYYVVDVGNPAYQTWLANWVKTYINQYGYDGALLDDCLPSTEIMWSTTPTPAINPRTGKAWTALEFEQAVISIVNTIKNTIGNKLVIGNVVYYGERFFASYANQYYVDLFTKSRIDGVQSEGWIMALNPVGWYSESKWKASIDFVVWLENNFLNKGTPKMFLPIAQNAAPYEQSAVGLPSGTTREQYVNYVFSSLLLGVKTNSSYLNFGYAVDSYTQSLFNIDVGQPLGSYYMINGSHVYTRDYSKVKVLVNPTDTAYTISLNGGYKNLDGTPTTSPFTLKLHTGIILRSPANVTPPVQISFNSGFETGDFTGWAGTYVTAGETAKVVNSLRYSGNYSAKFTSNSDSSIARAYCYEDLSDISEFNLSMRVHIDTGLPMKNGDTLWLVQVRDSVGSALASYGFRGGQTSARWVCMVNNTNGYASSGPAADTWFLFGVYYKKSSSGKTIVLNINGQEVTSLSLETSSANGIAFVRTGICYSDPGYTFTIYLDDVKVSGTR